MPQVEAVDWSFPATVWDVVAMGRFPRLKFWQRFGERDRERGRRGAARRQHGRLAQSATSRNSPAGSSSASLSRARSRRSRKLLLLDEPTTGVDAETEEALREVVRALVADGLPVLMTTHDLDRVDDWFDRLLVLDRRVLAVGTPREVVASGAYAAIREHTHTHGHLRTITTARGTLRTRRSVTSTLDRAVSLRVHAARLRRGAGGRAALLDDGHVRRACASSRSSATASRTPRSPAS